MQWWKGLLTNIWVFFKDDISEFSMTLYCALEWKFVNAKYALLYSKLELETKINYRWNADLWWSTGKSGQITMQILKANEKFTSIKTFEFTRQLA